MGAVLYDAPELPILLATSSFIYLLNVAEVLFSWIINAIANLLSCG
jgi:hypothetical protein